MPSQEFLENKELLEQRRNRAIATILSFKDQHCDPFLPKDVSSMLRREILDQVNQLCDFALDLLNEDVIHNDYFMEKFNSLYEMVSEIYDD